MRESGLSPNVVRLVILGAFLSFAGCVFGSCVTRVDAGHVGIRVKLAGNARGVQDAPTVSGWILYNPLSEEIVKFPVNVQNVTWTQNPNEGAGVDESITFTSSEGVTVNADVGLAFHVDRERAPRLYARFREQELDRLTHGYIRNVTREALNEVASSLPVQEIYGTGKTQLVRDAQRIIDERLRPDGFIIDQLTLVSSLRLPANVQAAINRAIEATQSAIQAENRVRQTRAEADQAIAAARGEAEAARQRAEGTADAMLIEARAEAQANEIVRLSTSAEVLQYRMIDRWDGHLPAVTGGPIPLLTVDSTRFMNVSEADRSSRLRELLGATAAPTAAVPSPTPAANPNPTPNP